MVTTLSQQFTVIVTPNGILFFIIIIFYINRIIHYTGFCAWLLSLCIEFVRFTCVIVRGGYGLFILNVLDYF